MKRAVDLQSLSEEIQKQLDIAREGPAYLPVERALVALWLRCQNRSELCQETADV